MKILKGVDRSGFYPNQPLDSTLSLNSNCSSGIGVASTLQFHPKVVEWSPNLFIHSGESPSLLDFSKWKMFDQDIFSGMSYCKQPNVIISQTFSLSVL